MMVINESTIQVFGIRRSGNHAIISWILDHFDQPKVHLNDVKANDSNPYKAFSQANVYGLSLWQCKPFLPSYLKHALLGPQHYPFVRSDNHVKTSYIQQFSPKKCLVISYEDQYIDNPVLVEFTESYEKYIGQTENIKQVVVLRDVYNLFASLIKSGRMTEANTAEFIQLYKHYAKHFIDPFSDRPSSQVSPVETVYINYSKWFLNAPYRCDIAARLGFETDGRAYEKVPKEGGGSTFDGRAFHGKASNLKVLERWKHMQADPVYQSALQDRELTEYSDRIFGKISDS